MGIVLWQIVLAYGLVIAVAKRNLWLVAQPRMVIPAQIPEVVMGVDELHCLVVAFDRVGHAGVTLNDTLFNVSDVIEVITSAFDFKNLVVGPVLVDVECACDEVMDRDN